MKCVCVSDTHRNHIMLDTLKGDILLHTGDFTDWGSIQDIIDFSSWLEAQDFKHKVVISGNHDVKFESSPEICKAALKSQCKTVHYLENESITLEGFKIFGSPYTPRFAGGFQIDPFSISEKEFWMNLIPNDVDILMTHGPPHGILDKVIREDRGFGVTYVEECGSKGLLEAVIEKKPKLHCFGHIHEGYGIIKQRYGITFVNASAMNWRTNNLNKPIEVELDEV